MQVGERVVGVRSNDAALLERFRALVAPALVEGVDASPNVSLRAGSRHGPVRDLHLLYRRGRQVLRTASDDRLLRAALAHLDAFLPPPPGTLRLRARVLTGPAGAVLVDEAFGHDVELAERRLAASGWEVTDTAGAVVDPDRAEVVLGAPRVALDERAWGELAGNGVGVVPTERRVPVAALVGFGAAGDSTTADGAPLPSPSQQLRAWASLLETVTAPALTALRPLASTCPRVERSRLDHRDLVALVDGLG